MSDFTLKTFFYGGQRASTEKGKALDLWYPENGGEHLAFSAQKGSRAIGGRYAFEVSADGQKARVSAVKWVGGVAAPDEMAAEWQAKHDAFVLSRSAAKLEQDAKKRALLETLEPLRRAYQATNYDQRLAMEVAVLSYLRRGLP